MARTSPLQQLVAPALALFLLTGCTSTPAESKESPTSANEIGTGTAASPSATPAVERRGERAVVERVVDGDTIIVQRNGQSERVRLLNIDTPETKDPNELVQCLGPEATSFLEDLLPPGTPVGLEYDQERVDGYGRTLAGVFMTDGRLVNAEIARRGLGTPLLIKPNDRFLPPVEEAFAEAESQKVGLLDPTIGCTLPAQVRKATSALDKASPEDLASATGEAATTVALLANLDAVDGDLHPHIRHLVALPSLRGAVATMRARVGSLQNSAAAPKAGEDQAPAKESAGGSGESDAAPVTPHVPDADRAPAVSNDQAPAAPVAPPVPRVDVPAAPVVPDPPAPAKPAPAPAAPAPAPQPNVVDQAPPGYFSEIPGYTGPRCYAPGGKVFRPC